MALSGSDTTPRVLDIASYCVLPPPHFPSCLTWLTYSVFSFLKHCRDSSVPAIKHPVSPS